MAGQEAAGGQTEGVRMGGINGVLFNHAPPSVSRSFKNLSNSDRRIRKSLADNFTARQFLFTDIPTHGIRVHL